MIQKKLSIITKNALAAITLLSFSLALTGCDPQKGPPDTSMVTSVSGSWVGKTNPDVSLDIQDGGSIKITKGGKESIGTWKQNGAGAIKATIDGQDYDMPYTRKDLNISITLPGESSPSEFTQM